jgi:hypothetical protein
MLVLLCAGLCRAGVGGRLGLEAVAVSHDGKSLAVGGQNRVVYLLDAGSLEVKKRLSVKARVGNLAFSKDGKRLAVEDEDDVVRLIEVATGKEVARVSRVAGLTASGDLIAVRDVREFDSAVIRLLSLADLKEVGKIELTYRPAAWAFTDGGKRLLALSLSQAGSERRIAPAKFPKDLSGLARQEFRLKNDGLESLLELREVAGGKTVERARLWFTSDSDSTVLARTGKVVHVLNRGNLCARVEGGAAKLYATPLFVNHAIGVSPDGSRLVLGAGGEGYWGRTEGDKGRKKFTIEALSGQEWFTRVAVLDDGRAFGVTSAFRAVRIDKEGDVEKIEAVY